MNTKDLHAKVDQLLHDAEHKDAAVDFAEKIMRDIPNAKKYRKERNKLIAEAKKTDPARSAPAWKECGTMTSEEFNKLITEK